MPNLNVERFERYTDDDGSTGTIVEYPLPEVGLSRGQSHPERGNYGGHTHHIPDTAVQFRAAMYGISFEEALEECVLERVDKPARPRLRPLTPDERRASRTRWQIRGQAMAEARRALPAHIRTPEAMADAERRVMEVFAPVQFREHIRNANAALHDRIEKDDQDRRARRDRDVVQNHPQNRNNSTIRIPNP